MFFAASVRASKASQPKPRAAIVTGGSSGIGIETARALASAAAEVTLAVRDTDAGERTAADITATTGNRVRIGWLDLADQRSLAAFIETWRGPLHLLVNNAGVMGLPDLERTRKGGSSSSRPITLATSRSRSAFTARSPPLAVHESCR